MITIVVIISSIVLPLVLILFWILFAPLWIVIDTRGKRFFVDLHGLLRLRYAEENDRWKMLLRVFWIEREVKITRHITDGKDHIHLKTEHFSIKFPFGRILNKSLALAKTFSVKKFVLTLDTGDVILNAYLFPLFYLLSNEKRKMKIAYNGEFVFVLEMKNRIVRMLRPLFLK